MANRNFQNNNYHLERSVVELFADVSIGATGAPTLDHSMGITSLIRNSEGNYTLNLDDGYSRLLSFDITLINDTIGEHTIERFNLVSEDVLNKTLNFVSVIGAVATEIPDGSRLLIRIKLKNSRLNR